MKLEYELLTGELVVAYDDYHEAKQQAENCNLKLAEYGDVYGQNMAYAYWNKSGDRNDTEEIIAYYRFNKNGKPQPLETEELEEYLFR